MLHALRIKGWVVLLAGIAPVFLLGAGPRKSPCFAAGTASGASFAGSLSADGRWLAFSSEAPDLVSGILDGNRGPDVFLYDRVAARSVLVSRSAALAGVTANGPSFAPEVSADGRFVLFRSEATDLVPGQDDANGGADVFLYDRVRGTTVIVSRSRTWDRRTAGRSTFEAALSADGQWAVFTTNATDVAAGVRVPPQSSDNVYLWSRITGAVSAVSRSARQPERTALGISRGASISADGRLVAFLSTASDLVAGQDDRNAGIGGGWDVFLWERGSARASLVSRAAGKPRTTGNGSSLAANVSANGRWVVFRSGASNLLPGPPREMGSNLYLFERAAGTVRLATHGAGSPTEPLAGSFKPLGICAAGRFTLALDESGPGHLFLYAREPGRMTLVDHSWRWRRTGGNGGVEGAALSADGNTVAFSSAATNLVPALTERNWSTDVFLWDRRTGEVSLVSYAAGSPGVTGSGPSRHPVLSADGAWIAYDTEAPDLVPEAADGNGASDVVLQSRTGERILVTLRAPGP